MPKLSNVCDEECTLTPYIIEIDEINILMNYPCEKSVQECRTKFLFHDRASQWRKTFWTCFQLKEYSRINS